MRRSRSVTRGLVSDAVIDQMNGFQEYSETHKNTYMNKGKSAVRMPRFDMCTLFSATQVLVTERGYLPCIISAQLYAGCAVVCAIEGNFYGKPSLYSASP